MLANGELPFVIFFGAQALFAFFGIGSSIGAEKQLGGERWHELAQLHMFLFNPLRYFFQISPGTVAVYWLKRMVQKLLSSDVLIRIRSSYQIAAGWHHIVMQCMVHFLATGFPFTGLAFIGAPRFRQHISVVSCVCFSRSSGRFNDWFWQLSDNWLHCC